MLVTKKMLLALTLVGALVGAGHWSTGHANNAEYQRSKYKLRHNEARHGYSKNT